MSERTWRIVTPEAVALDLEAAGLASRVIAALLDFLVFWMVVWAFTTVLSIGGAAVSASGADNSVLIAVVAAVGFFLLLLAWPVAWEFATKGRSVGKMAVGIRVVTLEGAPIRFRHALVRGLLGVVELLLSLGSVALFVALSSRRFRRLGDHLAGTVVIRDRSATKPTQAIRFLPLPGWEEFASALDVSRLTSDHHRLVRSFLLRAPSLRPAKRVELGNRILDTIAAAAAFTPGQRAGLYPFDPVLPLTAVAAAYQRRFSPDPVLYPYAGMFTSGP